MNDLIYGKHVVFTLISSNLKKIKQVYLTQTVLDKNADLFESAGDLSYQVVDKKWFAKNFEDDVVHQFIAAKIRNESNKKSYLSHLEKETSLYLILDKVQDPHNLGSCLRTALALGADAVIMPNASCPINSTVRKVASGAAMLFQVTM